MNGDGSINEMNRNIRLYVLEFYRSYDHNLRETFVNTENRTCLAGLAALVPF